MKEILMGYHVDSAFLPVLFSFGDEPHIAESGAINVATKKLGSIRPRCKEPIYGHRNKQWNGDCHEKDQLSHRKDSRIRREIDNGQHGDQMDHYRIPLLPFG